MVFNKDFSLLLLLQQRIFLLQPQAMFWAAANDRKEREREGKEDVDT